MKESDVIDVARRPGEEGGRGPGFEIVEERTRWLTLPPRLPKDVVVESTGNGVRVRIIGRGRSVSDGPLSGTTRYDIHWVAECDTASSDRIAAALGRAIVVESMPEPGENVPAEKLIADGKYLTGWYMVTGVNILGDRSEPSTPRQVTNGVLDFRVPPNPSHFAVSESGEVHNGMVYSALSVAYGAPSPLAGFYALQLVLQDYPNRSEITEWVVNRYNGLAGGSASFKALLEPARRPGKGTITATNGNPAVTFGGSENVLLQAVAGDQIEILGIRATIQSVDSATAITLTANWTGQSVTAFADYVFLGKVRVYGRAVSAGGGYESDLAKLPYVDVILDGELSAPNAPTLAVTADGNVIRAAVTLPAGTAIDHAVLYRGTGAGVAFASCTPIKTWPADQIAASATLQYEDTNFTIYQRENGQTFSYYAVAVNVRDQQSSPSTRQEASCKLDSPQNNSPQNPARDSDRNLLWDAMLAGTSTLDPGDTTQDANLGGVPPPAGHYRWAHETVGSPDPTPPGFQNTTEIILPAPGSGKEIHALQRIDAWDHPTSTNRRVPKGKYLAQQCKVRTSAGSPNGTVKFWIEQHDETTGSGTINVTNGSTSVVGTSTSFTTQVAAGDWIWVGDYYRRVQSVTDNTHLTLWAGWQGPNNATASYTVGKFQGYAKVLTRNTDDSVSLTSTLFSVNGSDVLGDHHLYWVVLGLDTTLTTKYVLAAWSLNDTNNGVNINFTHPMVSIGEALPQWTAEMVDPDVSYGPPTGGVPIPPGRFEDQDGEGRHWMPLEP